MSAYLGPVGMLTRLKCASSLRVADEDPVRYRVSVGRRRYAQVMAPGRTLRTWDVSWFEGTTTEMVSIVDQLSRGLAGPGPFVYYSEQAAASNILTPQESAVPPDYTGQMSGGSVTVSDPSTPRWDGRVLSTVTQTSSSVVPVGGRVPVPDETPLTASAYLTAQAGTRPQLVLRQYDPQGVMVREHRAQGAVNAALERVHLTIATDPRTVTVQLATIGVLRTAAPAISLTDRLVPWTRGQGCRAVMVSRPAESVWRAVQHTGEARRSGFDFTITEVG